MNLASYANSTLAVRAIHSLKGSPLRTVIIDRTGLGRRPMRALPLLAASLALAERLRDIPQPRIGLVLPPGAPAWIANLAVAMADKVSVNLNFTAAPASVQACMEAADVRTVISAAQVKDKIKTFPWLAAEFFDLGEFFGQTSTQKKIKSSIPSLLFSSANSIVKRLNLQATPEGEATLLFSSGSTGTPKGVPLTHKNILTNLMQIDGMEVLPARTRLIATLPLFHSFGITTSLWYSITHPICAVTYTSPLETQAIGRIVQEEQADVMVGAPAIFQLYLRQIPAPMFRSLRAVVAGADKTPAGLEERWQRHYGSAYLQGYGLTETSPVVSCNKVSDNVIGTVGRLVAGLEARTVDVDTGVVLAQGARGVLQLRGDNVFNGYLNDPETNRRIITPDGWFSTGDLAAINSDGTLTIHGRLRRFSKIGGEMVSHIAVEAAVAAALGIAEEDRRNLAVAGVPDELKGEQLAVVYALPQAIDMGDLRQKLGQMGQPNLYMPRYGVRVAQMPYLPSGKLDLQQLNAMAREGMEK